MVPSAEQTLGHEKFASMMSAPAATAHSAQRQKSAATSSGEAASGGVATTETTSICPSARLSFARRTSGRQTSGAMDGIPKQTADVTFSGLEKSGSVVKTGPLAFPWSSTKTQLGKA